MKNILRSHNVIIKRDAKDLTITLRLEATQNIHAINSILEEVAKEITAIKLDKISAKVKINTLNHSMEREQECILTITEKAGQGYSLDIIESYMQQTASTMDGLISENTPPENAYTP